MSPIVLDCSVTSSWFIPDEFSKNSLNIKEKISERGAIVPTIWSLEVGNVLLISERRKRINKEQRQKALYILSDLPIKTDELSLRYNSPLATFDNNLKQAGKLAGVILLD